MVILKKPLESVVVPLLMGSNLMDIPAIGFKVFLSVMYPLMRACGVFCALDRREEAIIKPKTRRDLKFIFDIDGRKKTKPSFRKMVQFFG